jgi:ATP-dependent RNA helicase DDX18/HAS1
MMRVQGQLEKLVEKNYYLNRSAKDAYRSYLLAYASHSLKHIFNVTAVDLVGVARGFGFTIPPKVNLNISATSHDDRKRGGGGFADNSKRRVGEIMDPKKKAAAIMRLQQNNGHSFSASNPYGKRESSDARQFSH